MMLFAVRILKYEGKEEMVQLQFFKQPFLSPYGWFYCENYHDYNKVPETTRANLIKTVSYNQNNPLCHPG